MIAGAPRSIPSPGLGDFNLSIGPLTVHAYALCLLAGILFAAWYGNRRYTERGGPEGAIWDITLWAVPFGIVGGRLYHVVTTPEPYFGPNGDPWKIFEVWSGGLGIWGAVALGAVGIYLGARSKGLRFPPLADALAPAVLIAQGIGRLGNWFNQELFGAPTTVPWGLKVDPSIAIAAGHRPGTLFHPTFLYEMLWSFAVAALLIWADRHYSLRHGLVFWLYVVGYTAGRLWIEMLRIDTAEHILGLRLNVWTSILVGLAALVAALVTARRTRGLPDPIYREGAGPVDSPDPGDGELADGKPGDETLGRSKDSEHPPTGTKVVKSKRQESP